ncbi:hypothetical protein QWY85_08550 [Neolewinella lacunae]|uniref:Peptidase M50 domain-containing protein n=1 Tax=Neolewinella lacunae TaxID=1517758 RepID=A0A923PIQ2_9BACT|nr:hypothetical protein [Neolewinella lacunae]MBC6994034.1 hypothetical protein [Neolewinella lacunae]MDN3634704.1 hypothetical protein [Neolewinella lacunae]
MEFIVILAIITLFTLWHELGHIAVARLRGLTIEKFGFSWRPYPHPYVAVSDVPSQRDGLLFLGAGSAFTLLLTIVLSLTGIWRFEVVYWAICIQWLIETNPFYSDLTLAANSLLPEQRLRAYLAEHQPDHVDQYGMDGLLAYYRSTIDATVGRYLNLYAFSAPWYLHFVLWIGLFALLFGPHSPLATGVLISLF